MGEQSGSGLHVILRCAGLERRVALPERLFVGRECTGVDPAQRLLVEDQRVSRHHLEIRVEPGGAVTVFDTSRNGTWLNGMRLERAVPVALSPGDRLTLGDAQLEFVGGQAPAPRAFGKSTIIEWDARPMALVAGDVVGYSGLSEGRSGEEISAGIERLFGALRERLARHHGTLSHVAGDALFAVWDLTFDAGGCDRAVAFALDAAAAVENVAPSLPLAYADGSPLRMGWGVNVGEVSMSSLTGARSSVVGDAVNVAFRLATMAARDGRAEVLIAAEVASRTKDRFAYGESAQVAVRGRTTPVRVLAVQSSGSTS